MKRIKDKFGSMNSQKNTGKSSTGKSGKGDESRKPYSKKQNPDLDPSMQEIDDDEETYDLSMYQPGHVGKSEEELYGEYESEGSEIFSDEESEEDLGPLHFESEAVWAAKKGTDPEGWDETVKAHFASLPNAELTSAMKELRGDFANTTQQLKDFADTTEKLSTEISELSTLVANQSQDISALIDNTTVIDTPNDKTWTTGILTPPPGAASTPAAGSREANPISIDFKRKKEKPQASGSVIDPSPLRQAFTPGNSSSSSEASASTSPTKPSKGKGTQKGIETTGATAGKTKTDESFSTPAEIMAPLSERHRALAAKIRKHAESEQAKNPPAEARNGQAQTGTAADRQELGEVQAKKLGGDIAKLQATVDEIMKSMAHVLGGRSTSEYSIYGVHPLVLAPGLTILVAAVILCVIIMGAFSVVVCSWVLSWRK